MISAIRGTHDILPGDVERWQRLELVARDVCRRYGYQEIRTPVIEREELFAKGTGGIDRHLPEGDVHVYGQGG